MRALGRHGPGIVPKQFKPLLNDEQDRYNFWPSFGNWVGRASAGDIVAAYEASRNPSVRYLICHEVRIRGLHAALPILVHALNDPDAGVRGEAAYSLGYFGNPSTGYDLFKRLAVEDDPGVRSALLGSLGSLRYAPALPHMIKAMANADRGTRHNVAWALKHMGDKAALPALRRAYAEEPEGNDSYYSLKESLRRIIAELERG